MDGELMRLVPLVKLNGIESFDTLIEKNLGRFGILMA
jgi:hypothetical protein